MPRSRRRAGGGQKRGDCPVDVVTEAGLRARLRPQVFKEARPL